MALAQAAKPLPLEMTSCLGRGWAAICGARGRAAAPSTMARLLRLMSFITSPRRTLKTWWAEDFTLCHSGRGRVKVGLEMGAKGMVREQGVPKGPTRERHV